MLAIGRGEGRGVRARVGGVTGPGDRQRDGPFPAIGPQRASDICV